MAEFKEKTLWTVQMPTEASETQLLKHAQKANCSAVAIRTSNARLPSSIARFHAEGIKVFGWRWPACRLGSTVPDLYAPEQAKYVANQLIPAGLDGFFADIESDNDSGFNDWDDGSFSDLASGFCQTILEAAPAGFVFSLTAGCAQPTWNPHIPWDEFGNFSTFVMPQTYWRWLGPKTNKPENINGGTPAAAYAKAAASWSVRFPSKTLVPIMGELIYVTPQEIAEYGALLNVHGINYFHAYTDGNDVSEENLMAIAQL